MVQADLDRVRKKKIGYFLRALNSVEYIANQFTRYAFNDMDLFDAVPALEKITVAGFAKSFCFDSRRKSADSLFSSS